jgi:hypothetical protein
MRCMNWRRREEVSWATGELVIRCLLPRLFYLIILLWHCNNDSAINSSKLN